MADEERRVAACDQHWTIGRFKLAASGGHDFPHGADNAAVNASCDRLSRAASKCGRDVLTEWDQGQLRCVGGQVLFGLSASE